MNYGELASRIAQVHSDANCEDNIIERYHTLRRFTQALMEECWKMDNKTQFNFILLNRDVEHKMLKSLAERGAAFQEVYGMLDIKEIACGANWTTEPLIQDLLKCGLITGSGWYIKLTPLGVEYCKVNGFYISTRSELLMPKLLAEMEYRDGQIEEARAHLREMEAANFRINNLVKKLMAVDGKDVVE